MRSLSILLVACGIEQGFHDDKDVTGAFNPADLTTPHKTDQIVQVTKPEVDVLWVVDNSCSMVDDQEALATHFPSFMQFFLDGGFDYHIGVISTDMVDPLHSGRLQERGGYRFIDESTPDPVEVFQQMALLGADGSGDERGREAVYTTLEQLRSDPANVGFRRDDASLHVVVISDEDDHSTNVPVSREEFAEWLIGLEPEDGEVTFSSIVLPEGCCSGFGDESAGVDYLWVTDEVGGIGWDLRTVDWGPVLESLGLLAAGLKTEFFLSELPVPGSIHVWTEDTMGVVREYTEDQDWVYNAHRNSVQLLGPPPGALWTVFIDYNVLSGLEGELPE